MNENHNPSGNYYDKYGTKNPIARYLMDGFLESFDSMIEITKATSVYEIGCGEGHLSIRMKNKIKTVSGSDISKEIISQAKHNSESAGVKIDFNVQNIYDLTREEVGHKDLIVCCEVLEHLEDPENALETISSLGSRYVLVSVPREPLWRILNISRGKYLSDLGNTPGHLQHWSKSNFLALLDSYFSVIETRSPLPWTMVLCKNKL